MFEIDYMVCREQSKWSDCFIFVGWIDYIWVIFPAGMPEDSRSCVVEDSQYCEYGFILSALTLEPSGIPACRYLVGIGIHKYLDFCRMGKAQRAHHFN